MGWRYLHERFELVASINEHNSKCLLICVFKLIFQLPSTFADTALVRVQFCQTGFNLFLIDNLVLISSSSS